MLFEYSCCVPNGDLAMKILGGAFSLYEVSGWVNLGSGDFEVRMRSSNWVHTLPAADFNRFRIAFARVVLAESKGTSDPAQ
jgi:hypothetical protein